MKTFSSTPLYKSAAKLVPLMLFFWLSNLGVQSLFAQQNKVLQGRVLFLSSGRAPAVGVKVSGSIQGNEIANVVYTREDGSFRLVFPKARDGHPVRIEIGTEDRDGIKLEVVNTKELESINLPSDPSNELEVVVCQQGIRDLAAQKYYNIIKTSSDLELAKTQERLEVLITQKEKDYQKIAELNELIDELQSRADSVSIYQEALKIASINTDNASKRILRYIKLLNEGKSIQEAREALSISGAMSDLEESVINFNAGIEELEILADAYTRTFEYQDAIECHKGIIQMLEKMDANPLKFADYYFKLAYVLNYDGQYSSALEYEVKALKIREQFLESNHKDLATAYSDIGHTNTLLGNYDTALVNQKKALAIRQEILDENDGDLSTSFNNIAITYQYLGSYTECLEYLLKALSIREKILDSLDAELAITYDNVGGIYQALGKYDEALNYQNKAINIREKVLGEKSPDLANSYNDIALTYKYLNKYEEALFYMKKAISIIETSLRVGHPALGIAYNNLGLIYFALEKFEDALEVEHKALSLQKVIYHPKHPDLAVTYSNLALFYFSSSQLEVAKEFVLKAIEIREEILKPDHPHLGLSYGILARIYQGLTIHDQAVLYIDKCLDVFLNSLEQGHPLLLRTISVRLDIYEKQGIEQFKNKNYAQSLITFDTVCLNADSTYARLGEVWNYKGMCFYQLGSYPKAIEAYKNAVSISAGLKSEQFYSNLGLALVKNGQYKESYYTFTLYDKLYEKDAISYRNWAVFYSLKNKKRKAFDLLQQAISLGYNDITWLRTDTGLNSLRKNRKFDTLLEGIETEVSRKAGAQIHF